MSETALAVPEAPALNQQGGELARAVAALQVTDDATFGQAGEWLRTIKGYLGRVAEVFDPIVDAAHKAHKVAVEQRKGLLTHALDAERTLKARMALYEQEQERKRREAEAAAARERARLEAEERERVAAEQKRLQAEAEEKRLAEAVQAEQRGDTETAERLVSAPVDIAPVVSKPVFVPPIMAPPAPRVEGVSFRDEWSAEVTDLSALVKAIAGGTVPLTLVKADQVALNGMARSLREAMKIPGVKAVSKRNVAARA
jgi:hypothetical protein